MTKYGYVRVSSKEQHEDRQVLSMLEEGVLEKNIYIEKMSGKDFDRPIYQNLLSSLSEGDLLCIKSIDRLGRNYYEIIEQWQNITKVIKANIYIIDLPILDTRQDRDLINTLINDIILYVLSYVADNEREMIRQRQKEGIEAARSKGVHLGRPRLDLPPGFDKVKDEWLHKEISLNEASRRLNMSSTSFRRYAKLNK